MQRIVITSSCAAVLTLPLSEPTVFSEQDWNLNSIKEVQELGNKSPPSTVYRASKTLAEKGGFFEYPCLSFSLLHISCQLAAWDFYKQHKPEIKWDLAVINPPYASFFFFSHYKNKIKRKHHQFANGRITGVRGE